MNITGILEILPSDGEEIMQNLESQHGKTNIRVLVNGDSLILTYNQELVSSHDLEPEGAEGYLFGKFKLTEEEINDNKILLLDENDEVLTYDQKENLVKCEAKNLEELIQQQKIPAEEIAEEEKLKTKEAEEEKPKMEEKDDDSIGDELPNVLTKRSYQGPTTPEKSGENSSNPSPSTTMEKKALKTDEQKSGNQLATSIDLEPAFSR